MIKAPFNFVPLSDDVFFPDWADQISQDIPFEDGLSGTIDLKITAESPIFVRNGHTRSDKEENDGKGNDTYKSFSKTPDGKYFIPATSIKGAIRNVLEIMSFGKMCRVNNKRYSVRDLKLTDYMSSFQNNQIHCGWMSLNEKGDIQITDNGEPYRISYLDIDFEYGTKLVKTFTNSKNFSNNSDEYRSSLFKINLFKGENLTKSFVERKQTDPNPKDIRKFAIFSSNNDGFKGTLVFTGQPGIRKEAEKGKDGKVSKKATGKFFDFVFPEKVISSYTISTEEGGLYDDFCFVYKDSPEWKYWKVELENKKYVPVFFFYKKWKNRTFWSFLSLSFAIHKKG